MADSQYPIEEFSNLVQPLVGLPVALPWKGIGTAIFLELGQLTPVVSTRKRRPLGNACISIEWDWRIEKGAAVLFGSSNSRPEIEKGIGALKGEKVQSISIQGQVPELIVLFSNNYLLRSMAMLSGDPEWSIKRPDGSWVYAKAGSLWVGEGGTVSSTAEDAALILAGTTAERWGVPVVEPKGGECSDCFWFVYIDGEGSLLDYGVCIANGGPLDAHAVNRRSGCPHYTANEET